MFVWRGHLLLVWLLIDYTSADKNIDIKDASADEAFHDYDEHGCDRAAGEYYCPRKSRCISTWESCEPLLGKNDDWYETRALGQVDMETKAPDLREDEPRGHAPREDDQSGD